MVSALLVGLIVFATFTGFDAATRLTADERYRSEAALLAAESQEQLRTDPATALDALESRAHVYTRTVGPTTYTITQEAKPVKASGGSGSCSVGETTSENGANIEISSSVTWPQLVQAKRPAVKQASIITPPVGSALEVDVTDGGSPPVGQAGVSATAKFVPVGSGVPATAEGTTTSSGCFILTGLATTSATVEVAEKTNFVTTGGDLKYPTKTISIAPNITTQYPVEYAEGGRVTAEFSYKGSTTGPKGEPVTGDTFVVENSKLPAGDTPFQLGSTAFQYAGSGEQNYTALTSTYATKATTATAAKYALGDLFPFTQAWTVYGGDCPENNLGPEARAEGGAKVSAGGQTTIKVPLSYTELNVMSGNYTGSSHEGTLVKKHLGPVKITNVNCLSSPLPNNAVAHSAVHEQKETSAEGHLENPFQPFGTFVLCMVDSETGRTYSAKYTNATAEGSKVLFFAGQKSEAEQITQQTKEAAALTKLQTELATAKTAKASREAAETTAKSAKEAREKAKATGQGEKEAREKAETTAKAAKTTRESEEATAKSAKEAREKAETTQTTEKTARNKVESENIKKWEAGEKAKPQTVTPAEKTKKVKEQETTNKADETTETTAKNKRTTEETAATTAKTKRATEESEATTAKNNRITAENALTAAETTRSSEEATATTAKNTRVAEEKAAGPAITLLESEIHAVEKSIEVRKGDEKEEATNKVTVGTSC